MHASLFVSLGHLCGQHLGRSACFIEFCIFSQGMIIAYECIIGSKQMYVCYRVSLLIG